MASSRTGERALVAEPDEVVRRSLTDVLAENGFTSNGVDSGEAVLPSLATFRPTLILLSAHLPDMDGYSLIEQIRQQRAHCTTPIVMIVEPDDTASIDHAFNAGATDFVVRPVDAQQFAKRLRYVMRSGRVVRKLRDSEAKNFALMQAMPEQVLMIDRGTQTLRRVPGTGKFKTPGSGDVSFERVPQDLAAKWFDQAEHVLQTGKIERDEFSTKSDADQHYFETRMVPFTEDRALIFVQDISNQKKATAEVYRLAYYDTLTGLPNRQSFLTQLSEGIRLAEQNGTMLSVLHLDLDNFKRINDALGHSIGDELLKIISERIEKCTRADDYVARGPHAPSQLHLARLGGDEFSILLTDVNSPEEAEKVAARITESISKPIIREGSEFVITSSIGIANYPDDGIDIDTLVKNADVAMYHAKDAGRNGCTQFSGTMSVRSLEHMELEHSLRRAILNDDLDLHYQPKFSLATGAITGVEALLRWTHPERGPISPAKFVPIAEKAGLILELGDWVLHAACRQISDWRDTQFARIAIAINVSGKQFAHCDMYRTIVKAIHEYKIHPGSIDIELTESELMRDADGTIGTLAKLKKAGLSLIVDDFGTGYSSLSYLNKFPIDALKIDRGFVTELSATGENHSICAAIVALAHSLDLKVIAEGVETEEQYALLRNLRCDEVQGYYFCRPKNAEEVANFMSRHIERTVVSKGNAKRQDIA